MSKSKKKVKSSTEIEFEIPEPVEPKPLPIESLYFWTNIPERLAKTVPPSSSTGISNILILPLPIPETFPSLDDFEIPYVRDVGIKACIEAFGEHLGCINYTFDYIQFWLLDVIVDCLWRVQDEYSFTKPEQKLVLEWVLYMFRIMRDPNIFFARRELLKLFKEAILMAAQLVQEGHKVIPKPDELFELIFQQKRHDDSDKSSDQSDDVPDTPTSESGSTFTISKDTSEHIILMDIGEKKRKYVLKRRICACERASTPSAETTFTTEMTTSAEDIEQDRSPKEESIEEERSESYVEPFPYKDYKMFHNPDLKTPARFIPLPEDENKGYVILEKMKTPEEQKKTRQINFRDPPCQITGDVIMMGNSTSSSVISTEKSKVTLKSKVPKEKVTLKKIPDDLMSTEEKIKMWQNYKLHEQELIDMDNSEVGVVPIEDRHIEICEEPKKEVPKRVQNNLTKKTETMLRQMLANMDVEDCTEEDCGLGIDYKSKNLLILCAIIDLVFDYFYQNFHFTLLKLAISTNPSILISKVNAEWSVPKQMLGELVKPKPVPKKKEKEPKKEKKDKKDKKGEKSKPSKDKKNKSQDKKKDKGDKKNKKDKKEKPKKLTKEEQKALKVEQEKQRLLQEQLEEEKRKLEENKMFMFPLVDAANDELYMELFENWEKPKDEKGKTGKKDKGDKKKK